MMKCQQLMRQQMFARMPAAGKRYFLFHVGQEANATVEYVPWPVHRVFASVTRGEPCRLSMARMMEIFHRFGAPAAVIENVDELEAWHTQIKGPCLISERVIKDSSLAEFLAPQSADGDVAAGVAATDQRVA